jgi:tetratricopeptide (TPR) repeat protein
MDVAAWLHDRGFDRYAKIFEDNDIDAEVLVTLTEADLKELGVWSLGHRRKLMAAIAGLKSRTPPSTADIARADARPLARRQFGVVAVAPPSSDDASSDLFRRACETIGAIVVDHGGAVDTPAEGGVIAVFGSGEDTEGQIDCAIQAVTAIKEVVRGLEGESDAAMPVAIGIDGGTVTEAEAVTAVDAMIALARTLAAAGTGSDILASKAVVDASAGRVDWLAMGELESGPAGGAVRAWRLRSRDPVMAAPKDLPVAGRKPVLSHFTRMIESCLASGKGQGVMILGPAGSGKTRLIEELASMAARNGFSRIALHNCGFGELQAGDAVASLAAALMGIGPDASPDERRSAIDRFMDSRVVERKWCAALNDLFFLPQDPETGPFWERLDIAGREEGVQTILRRLVRNARSEGPKLLTIEDIHNASARTIAQLAGLVRDLDDQPVVFAATARKEPAPLRPDWIAALQHNNARTIQLEPLTADEAAALASGFGDPSDPEILKCIGRARGNPLFLEQLLVALRAGRTSDGLTTVESLVLARCDGLAPIDRRALRAAAVLGRRGPLPAVRTMIDEGGYDGAALVAERILTIEGDRYGFAVAAVCDAVYGSLDRAERQDLHASAARCFAGKDHALYARHLERAADSLAPRAYAQAAETSIGERRHGRALALIRQGLQIVSLGEDRCHLTCLEADCLLASGSISPAIESYRKALEHAQHDVQRCRALVGIARGLGLRGRFGDALEELDTAQALAEKRSMARELARIHCLKGRFFAPLGRIHKAGEHFGLALDLARRGAMPEEVSRACRGLGYVAETGGRFAVARTHFADSVDTARTHGLGLLAIEGELALARTRYYLDPLADVLEHALSIAAAAAEMGHHAVEIEARLLASAVLYDLGRFEPVLEQFDRAQDVGTRVRIVRTEAAMASFAARALSALDRRDEARMLLGEALKAARETEPAIQGGFVLGAVVLLARGRKTRESALAEADELLGRGAGSHGEVRFYRDAIDAALGAGDPRQAMRYVGLLHAYSRNDTQPWSDFIIARGRALAAIGAGRGDAATGRELRQLMADAKRLGYVWAQPAMRAALDDLRRGPVEFARHSGQRLDVPIDIVPDAGQPGGPERRRS